MNKTANYERANRFSEDVFAIPPARYEPKPQMDHAEERCPYCDQRLPQERTSLYAALRNSVYRLCTAIYLIGAAVLRCVRFVVATVFCALGFIGSCCYALSLRVAHRDDRALFQKN